MKNKKLIFLIILSLLMIIVMNNKIIKAEEVNEEKVYSSATLEDNFTDNEILIVLSNEVSLDFELYNYTPESFPEINCIEVEDLTDGYKEKIEQQLSGTYEGNMPVNLETFRRIIKITLGINSKQYVLDAIKELEKRTDIISAEPNFVIKSVFCGTINDYYYNNSYEGTDTKQWAIDELELPKAWDITTGSNSIVVGIIDSGVDESHDELDSKVFREYSENHSLEFSSSLIDLDGHGTFIAGIIAAERNEDGIIGVCDNVKLGSLGVGYTNELGEIGIDLGQVAYAINAAEKLNMHIINCSFRYYLNSNAENYDAVISQDNYIRRAIQNFSGLVVCGAGNEGFNNDSTPAYPASYGYSNVVSVGASTSEGKIWNDGYLKSSNYGSVSVDFFAPGKDLISTSLNDSYVMSSGTSYATAYATGVAVLVWSVHPSLTPVEVKTIMMTSVTKKTLLEGKCQSEGILNAYKAVLHATHYTRNCECSVQDFTYTHIDSSYHKLDCSCGYAVYEGHNWTTRAIGTSGLGTNMVSVVYVCEKCGLISLTEPQNILSSTYNLEETGNGLRKEEKEK